MQSKQNRQTEEAVKIAGTVGLLIALTMNSDRKMIKVAEAAARANRLHFR